MIGFIICFAVVFGGGLFVLIRRKKKAAEVGAYVVLSSIGFSVWLSIFLRRELNPNQWIAWLLDRSGL